MTRQENKSEDIEWLREELANLAFVAERAGFPLTARDLQFALRSFEVEMRESVKGGSSEFSA